ncbi:ATP-binding protein [Xinfangfangia sp. D13-10-4-6]|uniref:ATP-binding protein n=1 Tax=Pseudogemmobacter hezensis TaxID=2737662 RepID=UPI0015571157|nr:ATP-binding protein [Pseudogemmobacter hezensis]NPD14914.1 ATP-binding protein [Pseudogemmobacter hezensis]
MPLLLKPDLTALNQLAAAVEDFAASHQLQPSDAMRLNLVLDELFTNAVDYGRQPEGSLIAITLTRSPGQTLVTMEDQGIAFDPLDIPPPDLEAALEDRPIGGLGIHFLMTFMTDLAYRHSEGLNRLSFRQIDSPPGTETE